MPPVLTARSPPQFLAFLLPRLRCLSVKRWINWPGEGISFANTAGDAQRVATPASLMAIAVVMLEVRRAFGHGSPSPSRTGGGKDGQHDAQMRKTEFHFSGATAGNMDLMMINRAGTPIRRAYVMTMPTRME